MSQRIFTNGEEGKILTSVGNRIVKQPYDLGKGRIPMLQPTMYYRSNSPIRNISDGVFTVVVLTRLKSNSNNSAGFLNIRSTNYQSALSVSFRSYPSNWDSHKLSYNRATLSYGSTLDYSNGNSAPQGLCVLAYEFSQQSCKLSINGGSFYTINTSNVPFTTENYTYLELGISSVKDSYEGIYGNGMKNNKILVFNRNLSAQELLFLYANGTGNEVLSAQGLLLESYVGLAEILDFSPIQDGSDMRVGCRDVSGFNTHMEIINLPAGTAQQKVDYANANLFEPFI